MKSLTLMLSVFSLCCTGCSTDPLSSNKTVHLSIQVDPTSFDPRLAGDRRSQTILRLMYEGLTRLNTDGIPELAIAERIQISPDKTVYTFYLRHTQWSNGNPVTAYDFEYAWKGAVNATLASPYSFVFYDIKNARSAQLGLCSIDEMGVQALDNSTLQVTLEHPSPYFLECIATPFFSPLFRSSLEKKNSCQNVDSYLSNGPFILKERRLQSHLLLEKNPYYWDKDSIHIESFHISILNDASTVYTLFNTKRLDWYGDPCCIIPLDILRNMSSTYTKKHTGGIYWMLVCTEKPYLSSPKIRKALACAINRNELVSFLQGGETPAFSILSPTMTMLSTPPFKDHDVSIAQQLFKEGLEEIGLTHENFPAIRISHWNEPATKAIAELICDQIQKALNITIKIDCADWSTYSKKCSSGDFDLATAAWNPPISDPLHVLKYLKFANNGMNGTGWHNSEYIQEVNAAESCCILDERREHMKKAEHMFVKDLPIIPLFNLCCKYAKSENLQGEIVAPTGVFDFKWLEKEDNT